MDNETLANEFLNISGIFESERKSEFVPYLAGLITAARKIEVEDRVHWMRLQLNKTTSHVEEITGLQFDYDSATIIAWLNKCLLQFDPNPFATDDPMLLAAATGKLPPMNETLEELIRN